MAFSPDGKLVATASDDRTVRLWSCRLCSPMGDLISDVKRRIARELTPEERRASGLPVAPGSATSGFSGLDQK